VMSCLNLESGGLSDATTEGLLEPLLTKMQIIRSAYEAAITLIGCDGSFLISAKQNRA
jgi:hypothetical protein